MTGSVVPGALRRLARDGLRITAIVLLALATALVAGVQTGATATLERALDENWRGAYDLLVTASAYTEAAPGSPTTMLPPNSFGSAPGQGLTVAQLEQIRAIADVEVAAPIGQVAMPLFGGSDLSFAIPIAAGVTTQRPRAYRVKVRLLTDDGLGPRLISDESYDVIVDDADLPAQRVIPASEFTPGGSCSFVSGSDEVVWDPADPASPEVCRTELRPLVAVSDPGEWQSGSWSNASIADGFVVFTVVEPPRVTSTLTLVDPAAEAALLGDAGGFLQPLVEQASPSTMDTLEMWARTAAGPRAGPLRDAIARQRELEAGWREDAQAVGLDPGDRPPAPVLPVLVSAVPGVALTIELETVDFGPAEVESRGLLDSSFVPPPALATGGSGVPVGRMSRDISALLDPFTRQRVVAPWPGTDPAATLPQLSTPFAFVTPMGSVALGGPSAHVTGDMTAVIAASTFAQTPDPNVLGGLRAVVATTPDGTRLGAESIYASLGEPRAPDVVVPVLAPVAEFDPAAVAPLTQALSYVPLGGYDPVGSTLVADSAGNGVAPVELRPSVSGLGLVNQATTMIGSFDAMGALLGTAPISAVRVRVSGVEGYSPESIAKVGRVQAAIEALGLTATVVAGSSPAPVRVTVTDYAFGTLDPQGAQTVGTLGVVEQSWSELAAANRIDLVVGLTTTAALVVGLAATGILLGVVAFVGVPRRRREAAVLRLMGWRRGRIARWYAAEEAVAVAVVGAVGTVAVVIARDRDVAALGAGGALAVAVLLGAVGVFAAAGRTPVRPAPDLARPAPAVARLRLRGMGVTAFGLRQVVLHPSIAISVLLTMATVGLAVTVLGVLVRAERERSGQSLLAGFVTDQVLASRLGLGAVAVVAGVVLAVLARRMDSRARAVQSQVLRAMGWTGRLRRRIRAIEALATVIPCGLITAVACWWLAAEAQPTDALQLAVTGGGAALLAGALTLFPTTKDERP